MSRYEDKNNNMKKQPVNNSSMILPCVTGVLFLLLIVLLKTVDVAPVGAAGTSIGLSHINTAFASLTGVNEFWYKLTEVMGVFLLLVVAFFGCTGLFQLIKRKSLLKVDRELYCLAGLYVVLAALYVLFEHVIINYRPILMDGATEAEASFPSSHTMLVCVVMGSAIVLLNGYIQNETIRKIVKIVCVVVIVLTVFGRLVCGVHWLTDILGGVLISATLVGIFRKVIGK